MEYIELREHLFGRGRTGLSGRFGLQTLAQTAGLEGADDLVKLLARRMPRQSGTGTPPVNYGWFLRRLPRSSRSEICLHRIGPAGMDDANRPGNVISHTFLADLEALQAIDHDIPTLLEWIRNRSPLRYAVEGDRDEGFAHHAEQVYETFGEDSARLADLPTVAAPIRELLEIRQDTDSSFREKILLPLQQLLGDEILPTLLRAVLCESGQQKPILVCLPERDVDLPDTELKLVEFLFTILPYSCRQRLTFCTDVDPRDILLPRDRTRSGSLRWPRLMVTKVPDVLNLPRDPVRTPAWIVDARTQQHLLPEAPSKIGQYLTDLLRRGKLDALQSIRDLASGFEFTDGPGG
jgi:hypothetical protein